jgi:hypothetical protein
MIELEGIAVRDSLEEILQPALCAVLDVVTAEQVFEIWSRAGRPVVAPQPA